jgi:hypothetical protein
MKKKTRHIRINDELFYSDEYRSMSSTARDILQYFLWYYYPKNPDKLIGISYRELRDHYGFGYNRIKSGLDELIERKYIRVISQGEYHNRVSRYRLNGKKLGFIVE